MTRLMILVLLIGVIFTGCVDEKTKHTKELINQLDKTSDNDLNDLITSIIDIDNETVVPLLIDTAREKPSFKAYLAMEILSYLNDTRAIDTAINTLKSSQKNSRFEYESSYLSLHVPAITIIIQLKDTRAIPVLMQLREGYKYTDDEFYDYHIRNNILSALSIMPEKDLVPKIQKWFGTKFETDAILVLGEAKAKTAIPLLSELIEGKNRDSVVTAIEAVATIGGEEALKVLNAAAENQDDKTAAKAVEGLGNFKDERVYDSIRKAANSDSVLRRRAAVFAILNIRKSVLADALEKALDLGIDAGEYERMGKELLFFLKNFPEMDFGPDDLFFWDYQYREPSQIGKSLYISVDSLNLFGPFDNRIFIDPAGKLAKFIQTVKDMKFIARGDKDKVSKELTKFFTIRDEMSSEEMESYFHKTFEKIDAALSPKDFAVVRITLSTETTEGPHISEMDTVWVEFDDDWKLVVTPDNSEQD